MANAYVALGANLGDCVKTLQAAVDAVNKLPRTKVVACSNVYKTAPVGYADQPDFYNAVISVETSLTPHALLGALLGIEAAMGRIRTIQNGPRVLDLDLLTYDAVVEQTEELTLPHPRMFERAFVMVPLSDIAPEYKEDAKRLSVNGIEITNIILEVPKYE